MCYNYVCKSVIITQTDLVWPFTIPQQTDLHKHNYNTNLLSMAFYNTTTNWFTNIIITILIKSVLLLCLCKSVSCGIVKGHTN
jgi:hypothetical protein